MQELILSVHEQVCWLNSSDGTGRQGSVASRSSRHIIRLIPGNVLRFINMRLVLLFMPLWLAATFDLEIEGALHAAVIEWLRGHPLVVDLVTPWLLITGAAFTIGLFTRIAYACFVAGVLVWAYVAVSLDSTHPHSTLVLALVALLSSKWGDAWSVDNWRRGAAAPLAAGRQYGYSVWVPGLVFGVGYGWNRPEVEAHGVAWADFDEDGDLLVDGCRPVAGPHDIVSGIRQGLSDAAPDAGVQEDLQAALPPSASPPAPRHR